MNKSEPFADQVGRGYLQLRMLGFKGAVAFSYLFGIPYVVFRCYAADQRLAASCVAGLWLLTLMPVGRFLSGATPTRVGTSQIRLAVAVILLAGWVIVAILSKN